MNEKTRVVLRWIAVFPGALLAGFLSTFPLHWVLYLTFSHGGNILGFIELPHRVDIPIEYTIFPCIVAITFVLTGFYIAPKYKLQTSIALTSLWIIAFFSLFIIAPMIISEIQLKLELRGILSIFGALFGLYVAWEESKKLQEKL